MIRVRQKTKDIVPVEASEAVEIIDVEGKLATVITTSASGAVYVLTPGDKMFNAYCRAHGLTPSRVHIHEPFADKMTHT